MNILRKESYVCVNFDGNNNKYWLIDIREDFSVHVVNGRMDGSGQKQKPKLFTSLAQAESFMASKVREKLKKGYKLFNGIETDDAGNSIASDHKPASRMVLEMAAAKQIRSNHPDVVQDLIKYLIERNIHNITSQTDLKYDSQTGLFKTSMGVVTLAAIAEARALLQKLADHVKAQDFTSAEVKRNLADYMMLIPQGAGRKLSVESVIPDEEAIVRQNSLLDDLSASIEQLEDLRKKKAAAAGKDVEEEKVFDCDINICEDKQVIKDIEKFYQSTRKAMHHQAYGFKIKRVFEVSINSVNDAFERDGEKVGNIQRLWHGTRPGNVLSILKGGLVIPKATSSFVSGRLFSDGCYFSDQSTKSLNYSCGFWNGEYEKTCFMFLMDVAMGKVYSPSRRGEDLPKPGYDSTFVPGGTCGVLNNEMIVPRTSQSRIRYLVEFDQ